MKPIQTAFKAAQELICKNPVFRLANEWRDSIFYTMLAAGAGELLSSGHAIAVLPLILGSASLREVARSLTWHYFPPKRLVGDKSAVVDHVKNASAAYTVANSVAAVGFVQPTLLLFGAAGYAVLRSKGAGLRDIPALYFNKKTGMWDWPRKQGGGGQTQTQKLKDAVSGFGKSLAIGAPRPAPVSALAASRFAPR